MYYMLVLTICCRLTSLTSHLLFNFYGDPVIVMLSCMVLVVA